MGLINLKLKSEYTFQGCFGPLSKLIEAVGDAPALGIADINSTWGHVPFWEACKKAGKKGIFGCQFYVVPEIIKEKAELSWMPTVIAKNNTGLVEIYHLNSIASDQMYYVPRVTIEQINALSDNVIILSGSNPPPELQHPNLYYELNPGFGFWNKICISQFPSDKMVVTSDNFFPSEEYRVAYELIASRAEDKTTPQHILTGDYIRQHYPQFPEQAILNTQLIENMCDSITLPQGHMVHYTDQPTLLELCRKGAAERGLAWNEVYEARLQRELELIHCKEFEDYFYLVADMIAWSKDHMLVGPARGSAAGSLVCYLLFITEIDPIPFGLLFERFIDITRKDLPDIDSDFPDTQREEVIHYLQNKYGSNNVCHIGTISRFKAKSAIGESAKKYGIPFQDTEDVKNAIIERSGGDARSAFCLLDTFESLDIGKRFIEKYPQMKNVALIENHARNSGCHAAGIIVMSHDVRDCCSVSGRDNIAQIDKHDAEDLAMLKMDILGLRTLSVLGDCMKYLGKAPRELYNTPMEDKKALDVVNKKMFSGIFQFEGYALQSLSKQMVVESFEDITAITSLARPGPLNSGGATTYIDRRTGRAPVVYDHPALEPYTNETFGVTVYQEQVMTIARGVGKLSWEDVTQLRKAMSKSLGEEFFNQYWERFKVGAAEDGMNEVDAERCWKNMCTFGSWAFNKSHAVSYALLSYWCMYLKAHHPLEFALACLNNEKNPEATIKLLRELVKEGYQYEAWSPKYSQLEWSIQGGKLIGGLLGIKGIGQKSGEDIISRRASGLTLKPGQIKLLTKAVTAYDNIFETETFFGDYYINPEKYGIESQPLSYIAHIQDDGHYIFIGKMMTKNQRDLNEYGLVAKRNGKIIEKNSLWLNFMCEDDTDNIICSIGRYQYERMGKPIVESGKLGDYYLIKGEVKNGWRKIHVTQIRKLS